MSGYYYGYVPYYGYPMLGQEPALMPPQGPPGNGADTPAPGRTMTYRQAYESLVACMRNLEESGVSKKEIIALLIWFGISEISSARPDQLPELGPDQIPEPVSGYGYGRGRGQYR